MSIAVTEFGFVELRRWMRERKMTLAAFEQRSGVDRNTVWRLLHGQRPEIGVLIVDKLSVATEGAIGIDQARAYEKRQALHRRAMRAA
jgi:transcriptional regulator with XRE-family HTH domain